MRLIIAFFLDFDPHTGLSVGAIVGIVVASCAFLLLILVVLRMKGYLGGKDLEDKGDNDTPGIFQMKFFSWFHLIANAF